MASGVTNRGRYLLLGFAFRGTTLPTNYYIHLANSTPTVDSNTVSDITEASNYTPYQLTPGATDFDVFTEDDSGDQAYVQVKDISVAATGACTATHALLTDDNVTPANRQILAFFDLGGSIVRASSETFDLVNMQFTAGLPA